MTSASTRSRVSVVLFSLCSILTPALASGLWETESLGEFRKGEFRNTALTSQPAIRLAQPLAGTVDTKQELVLCLARDAQGQAFCGTGNDGTVLRVREGGAEDEGGFSLVAGQVLALAFGNNDNLFAGTAPDGIIYRIDGDKGEEYFATGQKYVWALAFDAAGNLYAGTGDSGLIFKITGKGQGSVLYDADEPHIMCLARQGDDLYAGSSGSGLVYRLQAAGSKLQASVLYKTARAEVKALAVDPNGVVYAAANPDPEDGSERSSLIYRIRPDGNAAVIATPADSMVYALTRRGKGLLYATGNRARLYEVIVDTASPDFGTEALLLETHEGQLTALADVGSELLLGTGNPGKVLRLGAGYAREGQFESRAFDAGTISRWGRCFWTGDVPIGTGITFATQSGNSEKPDNTWEDWKDLNGEQVRSRPARFIRYRATLASADETRTPNLSRVTLGYAQTNLPPSVKNIQVKPEESEGRKPNLAVTWDAADPNSDSLAVSVYVRSEDGKEWLNIARDKTGLTKFALEPDRLPDGEYRLKLVVSDRPANPAGAELSAEGLSPLFLVDNTPPRVEEIAVARSGDRFRLSFRVRDELSLIARCDFSTNLKDWRPAAPEDGIFDAREEKFAFDLDLVAGENIIAVRAWDKAGNLGAGKKTVVAE